MLNLNYVELSPEYIYEYQKSEYYNLENDLEPFTQKFLQKKAAEEKKELHQILTPVNTCLLYTSRF